MQVPHWGFGVTVGFGVIMGFWGLPLGGLGSHWGHNGAWGIYEGSPLGFWGHSGFWGLPLVVLGSHWGFGIPVGPRSFLLPFGVSHPLQIRGGSPFSTSPPPPVTVGFGVTLGFWGHNGTWGLPLGVLGSHWGIGVTMGFGGGPLGYWGLFGVLGS